MKNLKIKVISDPGHAWGSVSLKLLKELNLIEQISPYSYMSHSRAYLEHHSDMTKLLDKLKSDGIPYIIENTYNENTNIRNLAPFSKEKVALAENIKVGESVYIYDSSKQSYILPVKIIDIKNNKIYLQNEHGAFFKPISFPYFITSARLMPEEKKNTIEITNDKNIKFNIHYENNNNKKTLTIYDSRFPFTPRGQKVASYYIDDFNKIGLGTNFDLGNSSDWILTSKNISQIKIWAFYKEKQDQSCENYFKTEANLQKEPKKLSLK